MNIKQIKMNSNLLSLQKARIIARLMADGCVFKTRHNYVMKYEVKDTASLKSFEKDIFDVYGLKMNWGFNPSGKTGQSIPFVKLLSKNVYDDLLKYGNYYSHNWSVPKEIINSSKDIKIEFLRSFYDDEGSVIKSKKSKYVEVRLYSINKNGLIQISNLLKEFWINFRIVSGYGLKRNVYAVVVSKKNEVKLFAKIINFNLKRKQEKLFNALNNKL